MTAPSPGSFIRALRPKQWIKNLLVLAAPIAAGSLNQADTIVRAVGALVTFIAAAGATYLLNDAVDVEIDRAHPTKRHRPIAAGEISVPAAMLAAAALALAATIAAFALTTGFGIVILTYLGINVAYSIRAKQWPGVELLAISSGFILRAVGGGAATKFPLSAWFIVVVCAASIFVVAGKRSAELRRTGGNGGRHVLRYYSESGLLQLRAFTATTAVVAYALWVLRQELAIDWLAGLSLVPFASALALYSAAIEAGRGEDPEDIVLRDHMFQLAAVCWLVIYGFGVYG